MSDFKEILIPKKPIQITKMELSKMTPKSRLETDQFTIFCKIIKVKRELIRNSLKISILKNKINDRSKEHIENYKSEFDKIIKLVKKDVDNDSGFEFIFTDNMIQQYNSDICNKNKSLVINLDHEPISYFNDFNLPYIDEISSISHLELMNKKAVTLGVFSKYLSNIAKNDVLVKIYEISESINKKINKDINFINGHIEKLMSKKEELKEKLHSYKKQIVNSDNSDIYLISNDNNLDSFNSINDKDEFDYDYWMNDYDIININDYLTEEEIEILNSIE